MRRAVHIAVFALLTYLIADRALLHAHGRDASPLACAQGSERVKYDALSRGFGDAAASSQSEAFMSACLVTGRGGKDVAIADN
ncbi:adhesin [Burkholderia sp. MR1-5-21]